MRVVKGLQKPLSSWAIVKDLKLSGWTWVSLQDASLSLSITVGRILFQQKRPSKL